MEGQTSQTKRNLKLHTASFFISTYSLTKPCVLRMNEKLVPHGYIK